MDKTGKNQDQNDFLRAKFEQLRHLCEEDQVSEKILDQLGELENHLFVNDEVVEKKISAQFSIYPLRQPKLSPTINQALSTLERHDLQCIPGSMSTLVIGRESVLWPVLREVFAKAAENGEVVMIVTFSNACPIPA